MSNLTTRPNALALLAVVCCACAGPAPIRAHAPAAGSHLASLPSARLAQPPAKALPAAYVSPKDPVDPDTAPADELMRLEGLSAFYGPEPALLDGTLELNDMELMR